MKENSKTKNFLIIILSVVAVVLIGLNVTFAIMSATKVNTGIIQFKQHKLDIDIVGDKTLILKPEELGLNTTTTKTLNISNPKDSTDCVFRIWLEFKVDGNIDNEYLTLSIESTNFTKVNESGKLYYNQVLKSNQKLENLKLNFTVVKNPSQSYVGKKYSMKVYIESIQGTRDAVKSWDDSETEDFSLWYEKVKSNLT